MDFDGSLKEIYIDDVCQKLLDAVSAISKLEPVNYGATRFCI